MEIKSTFTNRNGQIFDVIYQDINSELDFGDRKINGVHAYCFYKNKLVVVYADKKGYWTPPGGGVEKYETAREAIVREVMEESNMRVIEQIFIGVQDIYEPNGVVSQTRSVCIVEPVGPFVSDPDGDITEIRLIDPKDYKKEYFDWGIIGDHIMERALQIKEQIDLKMNHVG